MPDLHLNDIGTVLEVAVLDSSNESDEVPVDLSEVFTKELIFKKPSGEKIARDAEFPAGEDGTLGNLVYTVADGDLDEAGNWQVQAHLVWQTPSEVITEEFWSSVHRFKVDANL